MRKVVQKRALLIGDKGYNPGPFILTPFHTNEIPENGQIYEQ